SADTPKPLTSCFLHPSSSDGCTVVFRRISPIGPMGPIGLMGKRRRDWLLVPWSRLVLTAGGQALYSPFLGRSRPGRTVTARPRDEQEPRHVPVLNGRIEDEASSFHRRRGRSLRHPGELGGPGMGAAFAKQA